MTTHNFEFKEICSGGSKPCYLLMLNNEIHRTYLKTTHSKDAAEDKAWDVVQKAIKKYGNDRVEYDGCYQTN